MKLRFIVASMLLAGLIIISSANLVRAQWDALGSGYAVTTNRHGVDVPIGASVTAWAGTNDTQVQTVEFRWLRPDGSVFGNPNVPVFGPFVTPAVPAGVPQEIVDWANRYPGFSVLYASNTQTPDALGDWGVQAFFHDPTNSVRSLRGRNSDIIAIRATSFNAVPEMPLGTMVILLSMFGALSVFALRKKKIF